MADINAAGGLKWVKSEIFANLRRARDSLEKLAKSGPDSAQAELSGAIDALGEVRGILSSLQLAAPTRLTDELKRLCESLRAGQVSDAQEASEALTLALIQLPDYLDKAIAGQSVAPLVLLPSINDLRVSRGAVPLSEAELLVPTSVLSDFDVPVANLRSAAHRIAAEVRPQFHVFLLQWLRDKSRHKGLANLGELFRRFQECFRDGLLFDFFLVAEDLVAALLDGRIPEDSKTKALIARIDRVIKPLATDPQAWPEEQARALFLDLLSVMARCKHCSYPEEELLVSYGFGQDARQSRYTASAQTSGPAPVVIEALIAEAKKELPPIRDALDAFARGNYEDREQLMQLEPRLRNLADRLSVGGLSAPAQRLRQSSESLVAMAHGSEPADDLHLTQMAMDLVFVGAVLDELARGDSADVGNAEPDALVANTLSEVRAAMAKAERIVEELANSPTHHQRLGDMPDLLREAAGGLRDLSEEDAAGVLDLVVGEIEERFLESARVLQARELDLLAQAISGVHLYLGSKREDAPYGADLLVEARAAIETLGVESSRTSTPIREGSPQGDRGSSAALIQPRDPTTAFATSPPDSIDKRSDASIPLDAAPDEQGPDPQAADELVQSLDLAVEHGLAGPPETAPPADLAAPGSGGVGSKVGLPPSISPDQKSSTFALGASEADTSRIRVRADLIDHLLSNAGDIGIYGTRLAQQNGAATDRLGELEQTVERLGGQLHSLEKETKAQVIHSLERDAESLPPELDGLDPLGLDPFSTLQQLSRSLEETADDLGGLRRLLSDAQSEFATLLKRQARIAAELHEGLLRLRMVPFARAVPRLHRLVSQTAQQLGKEAKLEVSGPEVELGWEIQERVLVPVEHLLRNAVAHGIELPAQRERAGKPPSGTITLSLSKDDNDVVIKVDDDGAGLNLDAIRKSARDQGLIAEAAQLGDDDITELILTPGFSSVEEVSQVAGKGMGLDRVNTEVQRLSGSLDLETDPGHGTSFAIRLPLTRAILEALLVRLGDQVFAIPNGAIDATSRISRTELEACYRGEQRDFSFGGQDFRLTYLGSLLQHHGVPDLGDHPWLPILLARSGEQRIAFHVDALQGSWRILVKPVGPQHSSLRWLSGESVLSDGSLVLVLDLLGLMRSTDIQDDRLLLRPGPEEHKRRPCVMVIDDSLTVRRATSRMLQRQNMHVITARDGMDALRRLEELVPDVIVLDIEMPRMDGCELARRIRGSERLKDIPLIMISSRIGEKHRRHALDLGVDRYLGKPFQEMDLLDGISTLLAEASP